VTELRTPFGQIGVVVGFATESENLVESAHAKLEAKKLDLFVFREISALLDNSPKPWYFLLRCPGSSDCLAG
jgi:phosphopantothenoylcysteine synthetase/decarboxylase